MTVFLYGRVSTIDQNTDLQRDELLAAYPDGVYREEKVSATSMSKRDVLKLLLDIMAEGDKLVVWKLDRLARNMLDLCSIVESIQSKGASFEVLTQKIDTSTASGRLFLQMLGVFAEFENNLRRERQTAGIAAARARGTHCGRKPLLSPNDKVEIINQIGNGASISELAQQYKVSRATIYNVIAK